MVALFVCIACCLLETGRWAGCAPTLTQQIALVAACWSRSLHDSAKPLTPPSERAGEMWCLEGQEVEGLNAMADR